MLKALTVAKNEEKLIGQCVKRVLAQTHSVHSYVIIDDHSSDKTIDIVRELDDGRIRLFRAEDLGIDARGEQRGERTISPANGDRARK